ncbi:MAG: hypothetical protein IJX77_07815 [Ruminococcus sp.]|nr:hypothetical protein [Ruminococcus sp.]
MEILTALLLIPPLALFCGGYVGAAETLIQYIKKKADEKTLRRELEIWNSRADSLSGGGKAAEDKAIAMAMCIVLDRKIERGEEC